MLILIASSAAFTVTFSLLLSAQSVGSNTLGESNRVVIVSSGSSKTPITSVIPIALIGKIGTISGLENISPEVLAPTTLANRSVMVRGLDPAIFYQIDNPKILKGSAIQLNDTTGVMVGSILATEMNINVGDQLLLIGALYPASVNVIVVGIFHTGSIIDNEIVAPLWVGQWLRGLDYSAVSIIRVEVGQGESVSLITHELQNSINATGREAKNNTSISSILSYLPYYSLSSANLSRLHLNISPETSQEFLSKALGLSQESILLLSALVFVSLSATIIFAYQETVFSSRVELGTLKAIGMSSKTLTKDLILIGMFFAILATTIGWIAGLLLLYFIPNLNPLILAFYSITPMRSAVSALIGAIVVGALLAILAGLYSSSQFTRISKSEELSEPMVW